MKISVWETQSVQFLYILFLMIAYPKKLRFSYSKYRFVSRVYTTSEPRQFFQAPSVVCLAAVSQFAKRIL
jgi:hypothetical protein